MSLNKKPIRSGKKPTPKKRGTGRPVKGSLDWRPDFLVGLTNGLHVRAACSLVKINPATAYDRRKTDPEFDKLWKEAVEVGTAELEAEAARRAFHGTQKPVYQRGDLVGHIQEYSDTLMIFLLKARNPRKYRDQLNISGDLNADITSGGEKLDRNSLTAADVAATAALLARAGQFVAGTSPGIHANGRPK